jgi:hypothetical protein
VDKRPRQIEREGLMSDDCVGQHRYFVAEAVGVEAEGTISIVVVCTACGETFIKTFPVAKPQSSLRLKSENKEK